MKDSPDEIAERISQRTQRTLLASGLAFIVWELAFFTLYGSGAPTDRPVDIVRALAFVAWCSALLLLIRSGGAAFRGARVREIVHDEVARAHQALAYRNGFWTMAVITLAGYALAHLVQINALTLAHAAISGGVLSAVATLIYLGRR